MTTYDFGVTGTSIIRDALLMAGAVSEGEPISGEATSDALRQLNMMVKAWNQQGIHLWTRDSATLFLVAAQSSYLLGPAATDAHWTTSYTDTLLDGAASAAATTISVDSSTGMSKGDFVGIELTSGVRYWTTIKSVASATSLTLTNGLSGAASDNGTLFAYTSRPQRPLRILNCTRGVYNGSDIPVDIESFEKYLNSPDKTSTGTVTLVSYQPLLTSGKLYVWLAANSANDVLKLLFERSIADFDAAADTPNFPVEWAETLYYNLAVRLEPQYRQLSAGRRQELRIDAASMLEQSKAFDTDPGSIFMQP